MADNLFPRRVLFYLPVVTPWWFSEIVFPLITAMSKAHEVHVMIPPLWRGTGLGAGQAHLVDQTRGVFWHLLDGPNHPQLRVDASTDTALVDFVAGLAPDLTLCRSADVKTPALFPGVVKFIMEGAAPPLKTGVDRIRLVGTPFEYGLMPDFTDKEACQLDAIGNGLWADQVGPMIRSLPSKQQFCAETGIAANRHIIALPLEYEHPENFFTQHLPFADNAEMIAALACEIPETCVLAVTQHPLNELYGEIGPVNAAIAAEDDRVVLLESGASQGRRTLELALHCSGMIVGNSKSWAPCAAFGNPVARLSAFETGSWLNAYDAAAPMLADICAGNARTPGSDLTRRWFAYHFANCVFAPSDPSLSAAMICDYALKPHNPAIWDKAIANYSEQITARQAA